MLTKNLVQYDVNDVEFLVGGEDMPIISFNY